MTAIALKRWLRFGIALIAFLVGILSFASGILGGEPIRLWGSGSEYYQIVMEPPAYFWLWGSLGVLVAAFLVAWPSRGGGKR